MYSTVQAYTCYLIVVTGKTYCKEEDVYQGIPMFESLGSDQLFYPDRAANHVAKRYVYIRLLTSKKC